MKRLNTEAEMRNHSIQDRSKTQYADTVGRLSQKPLVQRQNLANVLSGRGHTAAEQPNTHLCVRRSKK